MATKSQAADTVIDDPAATAPSAEDELRATVARLQAQVQQLQAANIPADPNDSGPGYKYRLTLADGSVVEYQGAVPTHFAVEGTDDVLDVIFAARLR
jgi:hypothetical protein